MKKYIYRVEINEKHVVLVNADTSNEANKLAREFYNQNNHFVEKTIRSTSTRVQTDLTKVINLDVKELG